MINRDRLASLDLTAFDYEGKTFHVKIMDDDCCEPPWEHCDGHGPVSDWTRRDKKAGEWVLCEDNGLKRYYDFAEAMRMAKEEGWDAKPYGVGTKGERALRAVTADFEWLRKWCNDDWKYVTLHVTLFGEVDEYGYADVEYEDYLGRVEYDYSSNGYWLEAAKEMASEIMWQVRDQEKKAKIANRFTEAMECGL